MDDELERIKLKKMAEMLARGEDKLKGESEPVEINDRNFDSFITGNRLVVVDFWAEWCAPCRAIAPIVKELAQEYAGKVVFGKLNVDENPLTATRFGIMGIPTLMIFKNGRPVDTVVGAVPKRVLVSRISSHI